MSATFPAAWLARREPVDSRARAAEVAAALHAHLAPAARVLDLGAGTGANLRCLAPGLGRGQTWTLIDRDRALLDAAPAASGAVSAVPADRGGFVYAGAGFEARVTLSERDLTDPRAALAPWRAGGAVDLITASALLDLVSPPWLAAVLEVAAGARARVLFALSYDGRIQCEPADPDDEPVRRLVNRHQRTDKGFGPALGPAASVTAARGLAALGYEVHRARSDWRLGPAHAALQMDLISGWSRCAFALAPRRAARWGEWTARRHAHVRAGTSHLVVGHEDLVGWPADLRPISSPR